MNVRERKAGAINSRKVRQYTMGALFLVLLVAGWFFPLIGYFIPLCMVAGIGMASIRGRQWCNWYCPRGSFADSYMKVLSPQRSIPHWLRSLPLRIGVLCFLMAMLTFQIVRLWPDFYAIGKFFVVLLTVTTVVGVILAILFQQRAWCYICPIGSISSWVGKNRYQLRMDSENCVDCGACTKACPMELAPHQMKDKGEMAFRGDCLKCGLCVATCSKKALSFPE